MKFYYIKQATIDQWFKKSTVSDKLPSEESSIKLTDSTSQIGTENIEALNQENFQTVNEPMDVTIDEPMEEASCSSLNENLQKEIDIKCIDSSFGKEFKECMESFKVAGKNGQSERFVQYMY